MSSPRSLVTASKIQQYIKCPRSVLGVGFSLDRGIQSSRSRAAAVGSKLHACLQAMIIEIDKSCNFERAYLSGLQKSKQVGCYSQFVSIRVEYLKTILNECPQSSYFTQQALAMDVSGNVRSIRSYKQITQNDVIAGTADIIWVGKSRSGQNAIRISDWKTGKDIIQHADTNCQLIVLAKLAYEQISKFIQIQVISFCWFNPITQTHSQSKRLSPKQLDEKFKDVVSRMQKAKIENQISGSHCRYCPLKHKCDSFANMYQGEDYELD